MFWLRSKKIIFFGTHSYPRTMGSILCTCSHLVDNEVPTLLQNVRTTFAEQLASEAVNRGQVIKI